MGSHSYILVPYRKKTLFLIHISNENSSSHVAVKFYKNKLRTKTTSLALATVESACEKVRDKDSVRQNPLSRLPIEILQSRDSRGLSTPGHHNVSLSQPTCLSRIPELSALAPAA